MRSPSKRDTRKEVKPIFDADPNDNPFSVSVPPAPGTSAQPSQAVQDTMALDIPASNPFATVDEEMDIVSQETDENVPEVEQLDWINWKAEVQYKMPLSLHTTYIFLEAMPYHACTLASLTGRNYFSTASGIAQRG